MKHSKLQKILTQDGAWATLLLWLVPLLLIVPNIALDITEHLYTTAERVVNIILPSGVYLLLMSAWRRNGITTYCLLPVMVLCAFQIVLLFLYGESIIAIDMFLNVMTTNSREAGELLMNLRTAITVVTLLYLPPLILAGVALKRCSRLTDSQRKPGLIVGAILTLVGVAIACVPDDYQPERRLFPVNVTANIFTAVERTQASMAYMDKSDAYRFGAQSTRNDSLPEIYVLVIGETSRADNWQLNGYERPTNPRLIKREGLISFTKALSESNTTHKSVPLLMSHLRCEEFGDSIYSVRSVIDAFNECGYTTAWISNQRRNGALIDFFGSRADFSNFITDDGTIHHDLDLVSLLQKQITENSDEKLFIVLHTYGSHFNYVERYTPEYDRFGTSVSVEASADNRQNLVNAYDNTIVYTDAMVDSIISVVESSARPSAVLYVADHGEDIFDDNRKRFLHASPTPTYWQIHVPMVLWMSEEYRAEHPEKHLSAQANIDKDISSSRTTFHTLLSLAGIEAPCYQKSDAVCDSTFESSARIYLNDYNEAVSFEQSGLRESDFNELFRRNISNK